MPHSVRMVEALVLRKLDQRLPLVRDRVLLFLLAPQDPGADGRLEKPPGIRVFVIP